MPLRRSQSRMQPSWKLWRQAGRLRICGRQGRQAWGRGGSEKVGGHGDGQLCRPLLMGWLLWGLPSRQATLSHLCPIFKRVQAHTADWLLLLRPTATAAAGAGRGCCSCRCPLAGRRRERQRQGWLREPRLLLLRLLLRL
jgi:hypothetical protein